jgi:hypothetical protein
MKARAKEGAPRRFADPRIIEFKPRPRLAKEPKTAPSIIDPLRRFEMAEDRLRMQQNLAAAAVLAFLMAAGLWLFHELRTSSRALACIEAGHAYCLSGDRQAGWRRTLREGNGLGDE